MDRGKNKVVAGVLGILLGSLGVHHYYLGSITAGIICLVVTCVTCGAGSLLGFIEGILLLVMSDDDFNRKYNQRAPESMEFVFQNK